MNKTRIRKPVSRKSEKRSQKISEDRRVSLPGLPYLLSPGDVANSNQVLAQAFTYSRLDCCNSTLFGTIDSLFHSCCSILTGYSVDAFPEDGPTASKQHIKCGD